MYSDHPFQIHFDLNTKYFKVQLVPMHKSVIVVFCGRNGKFAAAKFAIFRNLPQILLFFMKNLIFHHF